MGENICFIIGNGFNHLIKEICNTSLKDCEKKIINDLTGNLGQNEEIDKIFKSKNAELKLVLEYVKIKKFLDELITLCGRPDELFKEFKDSLEEHGIKISDEKIFPILDACCKIKSTSTVSEIYEYFKSIGYKKEESFKIIYCLLKSELGELDAEILEILSELLSTGSESIATSSGTEFLNMEKKGEYNKFYNFFNKNGSFGESLRSLIPENSNLHIYTTNYDGLLNYLFMDGKNYILKDGFSDKYTYLNGKYEKYYSEKQPDLLYYYGASIMDNLCIPLHGTHKFVLKDEKTYKIGKYNIPEDTSELKPVMIFGNPNKKLELIKNDFVLKNYFEIFEKSLKNCSKLVIFGNSLESDPHIVKAILDNFDEKKDLIIVDYNESCCNSVKNRLEQNKPYNIKFEETKDVKTKEDLLNLFEELIIN
ncbi:hypothetical protein [Methanococcus maripaludis]|uniref:NAD-dependent SIR2 family protein deacetylase n=1 Tax=Methanococcus maripaludis TaxID=39152 RepID=A0A7J9S3C7_METMI|nr:hypothetical protein [Methanococcus maripaludis]MBB6068038.1 NAD-dependent SIR2 family protein deacetylase [Methanococcus maripaludis]